MIDHVTVRGGVWAAAGRGGTPLVFDLQPGLAQRLGKVVVHRARDGYRVGGSGLGLLVVLPEAAAEMLLNHGVTRRVCWKKQSEAELSSRKGTTVTSEARQAFYWPTSV